MIWFDSLILVILAVACVKGFMSGFVTQIATLAGVVLGALFAGKVAEFILPYLDGASSSANVLSIASFTIAFGLIMVGVIFAGKLINTLVDAMMLGIPNKLAGAFFCALKYLFVFSIALNLLIQMDGDEKLMTPQIKENSVSFHYITKISSIIVPYLKL
ncbi:membrane protein required for colicin V production [Dysgonomonas sp. PH5-45]|uniref:CvpA family protein n=1 Tax=unclassified Dysgonomonas TaxID=2630389 RepID=UPI002473E50A|nr:MULTISPECIES: CvpA family protein [unclassified Dysgonomonas]MDH6353769.1 membrane protein required for colicin V production [Dysgonomonas sp. PH5-45]MDH6386672.1 membrane protein required for colicin V production [Dysgonomonas sp. PH5-37]